MQGPPHEECPGASLTRYPAETAHKCLCRRGKAGADFFLATQVSKGPFGGLNATYQKGEGDRGREAGLEAAHGTGVVVNTHTPF